MKKPRRVERVLITPEQAEKWLEQNKGNRTIRLRKVREYAADITNDRWAYNFQAVMFDTEGTLIDGQHRLAAVVLAAKPIVTDVVYDADPQTAKHIDGGIPRTASDIAQWQGIGNTTAGCAIARWWLFHEAGSLNKKNAKLNPSRSAIVNKLSEMNEQIQEAIHIVKPAKHIIPATVAGFSFLLFSQLDRALAVNFFEKLASGIGYEEGSALHRLRERLIENRGSRAKLPDHYILALTIKAWNYFVYGRKMRYLRWKDDEPFPTPVLPGAATEGDIEEAA